MPDTTATSSSTPVSPIVHYADADRDGITFVDDLTLAPIPPLCDSGQDDDYMTFGLDDVTCPGCLALIGAS